MSWLLYDPFSSRVLLIGTGIVLLLLAFFLHRLTRESVPRRSKLAASPLPPSTPPAVRGETPARPAPRTPALQPAPAPPVMPAQAVEKRRTSEVSAVPAIAPQTEAAQAPDARGYSFRTLQSQPSLLWDLARATLLILSVGASGALVLVAVPDSTIERLAARLQPAPTPATTEKIALLYLGDEAKESQFRIRGVVRNISGENIEKLDANIRLYGHDAILLETHVVRMDMDLMPPDAAAQFNLVYPAYSGQIGSYSVDFSLRQKGEPVPFQDLRSLRSQN